MRLPVIRDKPLFILIDEEIISYTPIYWLPSSGSLVVFSWFWVIRLRTQAETWMGIWTQYFQFVQHIRRVLHIMYFEKHIMSAFLCVDI